MSSFESHPDDGLLLRHFDGELTGRPAKEVQRHLSACWQCRMHVEELRKTVAGCMQYRKQVLEAHLPPPPTPWKDLPFPQVEAEVSSESWTARAARWFASPGLRWPVASALAALLAIFAFRQLHETPSVQAAALLKRAVAMSGAHPVAKRQIQVRTRAGGFALDGGQASRVRALLETAHYNSEDPLSAKSYQAWRDALAEKSDTFLASTNAYRIRTVAAAGAIAAASLTLRATDLHPIEGRVEFRNEEWIELTEVPEASTRDGGLSIETNVEAPMRRAVPSRPLTAPSDGTAPIAREIRVLAALHEIGADLGDPIEVVRNSGGILVSGIGLAEERQRRIRSALDGIPNVTVEFENPSLNIPDSGSPSASATARPGTIASGVEQQLGSRAAVARVSSHVLDSLEAMMARAYAIRALAQRFPSDVEHALSQRDRQTILTIAREHSASLAGQASDVERTLAPVFPLDGPNAQAKPAIARASWQMAAEDLLTSSRRLETVLSLAMGAAAPSGAAEPGAKDLAAALAGLRAQIDEFDRLAGR